MSRGTTTSQQFRISDIAGARPAAADSERRHRQHGELRERCLRLITRFSPAEERSSEEAEFARRRYARIMAMDSGHHLRAALSMLGTGQQLTSAEVAAIVAGAENGLVSVDDIRLLIAHPERLPAPEIAAEIRAYVLESGSPHLEPLRTT